MECINLNKNDSIFKALYEGCVRLNELFFDCRIYVEETIKNEMKRNEIIADLRTALGMKLYKEDQKDKIISTLNFFDSFSATKKNIQTQVINEYESFCTRYKYNQIKEKYPDILEIEYYESEYSTIYFICRTNVGYKILYSNGNFIKDCLIWDDATKLCDYYSGYDYDNWLVKGSDPNKKNYDDYEEKDNSISYKLELFNIPIVEYEKQDNYTLMELWNTFFSIETKEARKRCEKLIKLIEI